MKVNSYQKVLRRIELSNLFVLRRMLLILFEWGYEVKFRLILI